MNVLGAIMISTERSAVNRVASLSILAGSFIATGCSVVTAPVSTKPVSDGILVDFTTDPELTCLDPHVGDNCPTALAAT